MTFQNLIRKLLKIFHLLEIKMCEIFLGRPLLKISIARIWHVLVTSLTSLDYLSNDDLRHWGVWYYRYQHQFLLYSKSAPIASVNAWRSPVLGFLSNLSKVSFDLLIAKREIIPTPCSIADFRNHSLTNVIGVHRINMKLQNLDKLERNWFIYWGITDFSLPPKCLNPKKWADCITNIKVRRWRKLCYAWHSFHVSCCEQLSITDRFYFFSLCPKHYNTRQD